MAEHKRLEPAAALQRMRNWCARQERSHKEVKAKLYGFGLFPREVEEATAQLISEGYLNEGRFATVLAGGKHRQKGWGWRKIEERLKQHGVSTANVAMAKKAVEAEPYAEKLEALLRKKLGLLAGQAPMAQKAKLIRFGIAKGYENELVWKTATRLLGEWEGEQLPSAEDAD